MKRRGASFSCRRRLHDGCRFSIGARDGRLDPHLPPAPHENQEVERGDDDADRLFFERALVMEGDTEMGLVLKNTLDAIGPLWH